MFRGCAFISAVTLTAILTGFSSAQDDLVQNPMLKAVMEKRKPSRLTVSQRTAMVRRMGGSYGQGSQTYTLSPRTMILSNRASMLMHQCQLFWPAADSAYFYKEGNYSPLIAFRIKVDPGTNHVIVSAGLRTDGMDERTWDFNLRMANTGQNSMNQQTKTGVASAVASVVFRPTGSGWYEGRMSTPSEGAFCLDFLELTLVR